MKTKQSKQPNKTKKTLDNFFAGIFGELDKACAKEAKKTGKAKRKTKS